MSQEILRLTPQEAVVVLGEQIRAEAAKAHHRVLLGLAGGPGAGKSTLGAELVAALNQEYPGFAALVPMDGFHMRHAKLEALGTAKDKGAPHTFEGADFIAFLQQLKAATTPVNGPGYSRKIEDVVDDAFTVPAEARALVIEGNYLLLADDPWHGVKPLLDLSVFLDVPRDIVADRLLKRHAAEGLFTEERNREHIGRVDLPNYDRVCASMGRADVVVELVVSE